MTGYRLVKWTEGQYLIGFEIVPESEYQKVLRSDLGNFGDNIKKSLEQAEPLESSDMDIILRVIGTGAGETLFDGIITELGL